MSTNDGGPAFPQAQGYDTTGGMSLRDWFAGQALAGMMAAPDTANVSFAEMATKSCKVADYMLAVREKGGDA